MKLFATRNLGGILEITPDHNTKLIDASAASTVGPSNKRRYEFPTTDADVIDERHSKFMKHKHWHTHYIKKNSQEQSNSQVTLVGGVKF